jgi:MFS family permease
MIVDLGLNTADVDRHIWIVNAYLIAYLVSIPIVGRLSDRMGRTDALQLSLGVFIIGSVLCASADSLTGLIIARTIQGAGGGALLPLAMALVGDVFHQRHRTAALGLVAAADTVGWAAGPIWGAMVVALPFGLDAPWRLVFWINVPLAVFAMVGIFFLLPSRGLPRSVTMRGIDAVGATFLAMSLTLVSLALSSGGEIGGALDGGTRAFGGSPNPLASYLLPLLGGALVAFIFLIWWERRTESPIVPLDLFRAPVFSSSMAANFIVGLTIIVAMVNVPLVVALTVESEGVSARSAALLAPFTGGMAIMAWTGGKMAARWGNRRVAWGGITLAAAGYAVVWATLQQDQLNAMIPGLVLAGAGFGIVIAPIGASALGAIHDEGRGAGAGFLMVARLLGMTIGISTLTAFGVRRLQALTAAVEPVAARADESTAEFLIRQQAFIEDVAIPLSVRVVEETFLISAFVTLLALIPIAFIERFDEAIGEPVA